MGHKTTLPPVVVTTLDDARAALAAGRFVVLVATGDEAAGAVRTLHQGTGRLAVLVGDPGSPVDVAAAQAMADELGARHPE